MGGLDVVVIVGTAVLAGALLAPRARIAGPVLPLVIGLLLGFIPDLRTIHLPPETVLLIFLPALLFWESLTTSPRQIRADLRGILLSGTLLVVATAFAVAGVACALGMPWTVALVLGAAVAPTDATAVGVLARAMPRRNITVLRAESLINDGAALVIYAIAVGIAEGTERYTPLRITGSVVLSYAGGVIAGGLVAWVGGHLRRRIDDPTISNVAIVLTPFTAFLVAELLHGSGVIAVVVAGLVTSQVGPRVGGAASRSVTVPFWSLASYLLNGALFVLVGLEVQSAIRNVPGDDIGRLSYLVVVVWLLMMGVRFTFLMVAVRLIRLLDRRPSQRARRVSDRARVVSTLAGFRGAVSLAAALAVPTTVATGSSLGDRDAIVFVTAGVIVLTVVVQGLLLPLAVRWAHFASDTSVEEELRLAEEVATREAIASLPDLASELSVADAVRDRLLTEYEEHLEVVLAAPEAAPDGGVLARSQDYARLRLAVIGRKRQAVLRLRDERVIDDTVLRRLQARLDVEELRITEPFAPD